MTILRRSLIPAVFMALAFAGPCEIALADDFLSAFKAGVLAHDVPDLWSGFSVEDRWVDLNFEAQFKPSLMVFGGTLRPVIGGTVNTNGDTSHLYANAHWEIDGPGNLFFAAGFGAAIHDGETGQGDPNRKWLGSRVLFHIPFEAGIHLDAHNDLSIYFEHTSNANTMFHNEGLDRIGVRYGYRF